MIENKQLMYDARARLDGRWGDAIIVLLIPTLISLFFGTGSYLFPEYSMGTSIVSFIISGPLAYGVALYTLNFSRGEKASINDIVNALKDGQTLMRSILLSLLSALYVILWSLLLIIPGIIAGLSYSMAFFIIVEDDEIGIDDAITLSKEMMKGYKWKLFCLFCRFIGWYIVCLLTAGIGFLILNPYIRISMANFYDDVKRDFELRGDYIL